MLSTTSHLTFEFEFIHQTWLAVQGNYHRTTN